MLDVLSFCSLLSYGCVTHLYVWNLYELKAKRLMLNAPGIPMRLAFRLLHSALQ